MKHLNRPVIVFVLFAMLIVSLGITAQPAVAVGPYVCLPNCSTTDGRMLSLASVGYSTLAGQTIFIKIAVPATMSSFEIGIFDGDTSGIWDLGSTALSYTLFADPTNTGEGSIQLAQWSGNSMADNAWTDLTVNQDAQALAPSGYYFYSLHIDLPNAATVKTWSNFKVRSNTPVEMSANESFAYAIPLYSQAETSILYPQGPWTFDPSTWSLPTTFDGTWDMYFYIPTSGPSFELFDGDMDYGKYDCSENDTNDADTSDVGIPPWAEGISDVPEGVASTTSKCNDTVQYIIGPQGQTYATGNPYDDHGNPKFRRAPSVIYDVIDPTGNVYSNTNPSGNAEWEQFRIDTDSNTPADYHVGELLPAGIYHVHVTGLDISNLNAWHPVYDLVCVHEDGSPCIPVLHPYLIGDTVWKDANGNGIQDNGEAGISGVVVTLLDSNGLPVPGGTAVTDANGNYIFSVDAGTYSVQVDASNFNTGGALAGLTSTTGGEVQTNTVTTDNVLTYDFGYNSTYTGNYCGFIRTPGFWKNYSKHMSDATFLNLIAHTQDFSYLTIAQAVKILSTNKGKTRLGIPALDGTDARFLKFLLTAEINAVWNGEDNAADLGGQLGMGFYDDMGMTVNQLLHQAYLDRRSFSSAQYGYALYLGSGGEGSSSGSCLIHP